MSGWQAMRVSQIAHQPTTPRDSPGAFRRSVGEGASGSAITIML